MIISCPECNKRFNIDQNLIPEDGRLLQCSNCMHKWHFIIEKNEKIIEQPIKSEEIITESKNQEKKINPSQEFIPTEDETVEKKLKKEQKEQKIKKKEQKRKKKDKPIKLLNMIIVVIISVAALIIIIDTFRIELSKFMPFLNPMLDSFYAIISDINSFIKDLIR